MTQTRKIHESFWKDESGISAVEYAMLLAMIAGGIVMAADMLSDAISNQYSETANLLASDGGCSNNGSGDGTGGDGGPGQGGGNTC